MGQRKSDGKSVAVVVPEETVIVPGNWYTLDGFTGMAMFAVTTGAGETGKVVLETDLAEYEVKQAAAAFAVGDLITFAAGVFADAAAGNEIGRVTKAADANGVFWFQRIAL